MGRQRRELATVRERDARPAITLRGLEPDKAYRARVVPTKTRAPDGPPSSQVWKRTPAFESRLAGTDPEPLTGANLHGAAVLIDLQGAEWSGARRYRVSLSGINTRMWVDRVERVSASRLKVILGNRGPWPVNGGSLIVTVYADLHTWNQDVVVTVPVQAPEQAMGLSVAEFTDTSITVTRNRVEGNNVYYQVRWKETAATNGWVARWMTGWNRPGQTPTYQIPGLTPNTSYTVQVRSLDRGGAGIGRWSTVQMTTTLGATSPAKRASVTVTAADPVAVTVVAPDSQREALEAFYNATGGHSWTNVGNWLTDKPLG